jgi:hypothetical protein
MDHLFNPGAYTSIQDPRRQIRIAIGSAAGNICRGWLQMRTANFAAVESNLESCGKKNSFGRGCVRGIGRSAAWEDAQLGPSEKMNADIDPLIGPLRPVSRHLTTLASACWLKASRTSSRPSAKDVAASPRGDAHAETSPSPNR